MSLAGRSSDSSPEWLPGGRRGDSARAWWRDLARQVDALRARYPRALAELPLAWWREADVAEQVGVACAWRLDLDGGITADPREELAFHEALGRLHERLGVRARAGMLDEIRTGESSGESEERRATILEEDLAGLGDEPDVSFEEAFLTPNAGRPTSK
jgi:hypothetical protein